MALLGPTTIYGTLSTSDVVSDFSGNSSQWYSTYKGLNDNSINQYSYLTNINLGDNINNVLVVVGANSAVNGQNLLTAYRSATALKPNGFSLSSTNRAVIFIQPGSYGTITGLNLNTQYVDIVGLSTDPSHVVIDKINQTANDVQVNNVTVATNGCTLASNLSLTIWTNCVVSNSLDFTGGFVGGTTLSGTFNNCVGNNSGNVYAGGGFAGQYGNLSGTFNNCVGNNNGGTFSGGFAGWSGVASGVFNNCTGNSSGYGGGGFTGINSAASGAFNNCVGTNNGGSYGGGFVGQSSDVSGTFNNCVGNNNGGIYGGGFTGTTSVASGRFNNCLGINTGTNGGGFIPSTGNATGIFINCTTTTDVGFNVPGSAKIRNFADKNGDIWEYN